MGRRGFEPLKHKCSRFQVPSNCSEAWTISLPWLLALGSRRLVSAPSSIILRLGSGLPRKLIGASLNSPTFPFYLSIEGCLLNSLPPLATWVPAQIFQSWRKESNLQPAVYKTAALPLRHASANYSSLSLVESYLLYQRRSFQAAFFLWLLNRQLSRVNKPHILPLQKHLTLALKKSR
jgi:hypothetical protein